MIFRNGQGKVVARLRKNDTELYKSVLKKKHMLRSPLGWAFDKEILKSCKLIGVKQVYIEDKETGMAYKAPLEDFFTKGIEFDRGYGVQICLTLTHWKQEKAGIF